MGEIHSINSQIQFSLKFVLDLGYYKCVLRMLSITLLLLSVGGSLLLADKSSIADHQELKGLNKIYAGSVGGYSVSGGSLLTDDGLKDEDFQKCWVKEKARVSKAWLVWMGDGAGNTAEFFAHDKWQKIKASQSVKDKDLICYRVEVTEYIKSSCRVGLRAFSFKSKPSVAGWSLICLWEGSKGKVEIYQGLSRLKPAESYALAMFENDGKKRSPHELSVVGGGGLAGNGSINQFNGRALSAGDDWNGSAGKLWDVDSYLLKDIDFSEKNAEVITIDPLLQWLFPVAVICYLEER